jgi:hypothetical protein
MMLPAYRPMQDGSFIPGYETAWIVEGSFWSMSWEATTARLGVSPPSPSGHWKGWEIVVSGALANHFFVLAYITTVLRWYRIAAACATISALFAIGCLLPGQIVEINRAWFLGPGYFAWCAATAILATATLRIARSNSRTA